MNKIASLIVVGLVQSGACASASWGVGSDSFAGAPNLTSSVGVSETTSLQSYTVEINEPGHQENLAVGAGKSAWWRWTAPENGWVCIHTLLTRDFGVSQPLIDSTLAVYTGSSLSSLVRLTANHRHWLIRNSLTYAGYSSVAFYAQKGTVYRVAVDGRQPHSVSASHHSVVLQLRQLTDRTVERRTIWGVSTEPEKRGQLVLRQSGASAFSAVLTAGRRVFRFRGQFDIEGYYRGVFSLANRASTVPTASLHLEVDGVAQAGIKVSVAGEALYSGPFPQVLRFTEAAPNPLAGYFTGVSTMGTATANVSRNGMVRGTLRLPDGGVTTVSVPLLEAGGADLYYLLAHRLLRSGTGYVQIRTLMREKGIQDDWITEIGGGYFFRAPRAGAVFLPAGMSIPWGVTGGTYTPPTAGNRPFGFLNPGGNGKMVLSGGDLPTTVTEILIWAGDNRIAFPGSLNNAQLRFNSRTGLLSGSIRLPGEARRLLRGVVARYDGVTYSGGHATGSTRNSSMVITTP